MNDYREDALLNGHVRLLQPARGHRAGTDAVLLAASAPAREGDHVVDVGASTGAVGLMIASRSRVRLTLVERDPALANACRSNLALNGVDGHIVVADILDAPSRARGNLPNETADVVVTNPPFLEEGQGRISPDAAKADAHVLLRGGTDLWIKACTALLKPGGTLVFIHRADCLQLCLGSLGKGLGSVRLRFIHPRSDAPAGRLVMSAVKGSRGPLSIMPPLVLHDSSGGFTQEAEELHRGKALLAMKTGA